MDSKSMFSLTFISIPYLIAALQTRSYHTHENVPTGPHLMQNGEAFITSNPLTQNIFAEMLIITMKNVLKPVVPFYDPRETQFYLLTICCG